MATLFQIVGYVVLSPVILLDILFYFLARLWPHQGQGQGQGQRAGEVQTGKDKNGSMSSVSRGPATKSRGEPRSVSDQPLVEDFFGCRTIYEMIQASVQKYGADRVAMRNRKFIESKKLKETDRFPTNVFDDKAGFDDISYEQLGMHIADFGSGLRKLGIVPIPKESDKEAFEKLKGDFKFVIFENTCPTWTIALQGAFSQSITVATCYATLGHDAVVSAVQETEAAALMVNWKDVSSFAARTDEMPSLKIIVASLNEIGKRDYTPNNNEKASGLKIVTSKQVMEMGKEASRNPVPPEPSDVAVIMYTSGSTSKPKGVVMRHSQLVAGIAGMLQNVPLRPAEGTFVSYLPLAHILALQVENVLLGMGATLCYSNPRDLPTALSLYKPTIFAGVPKVYETLKHGLESKISRSSVMQLIFQTLVGWKITMLKKGGNTPISNLFFNKISFKLFGGKLLFAISGGGPLSADLHYFVRACFNCPVVQGYALTETCVGGCFQALDDPRTGIVGPPVSCVELALQSEPDLTDSQGKPYLHTDRKGSKGEAILGRGEICMRGPSIASGYFGEAQKQEGGAFDVEGFFHTGDIGQFTHDGVIQIIDRKKNIVKLKGGEYVAMEAMETAFGASKFVRDICVLAHGDLDFPLAVVCVHGNVLRRWAEQENVSYDGLDDLANTSQARQAVLQSMKAEGKKAGLSSLEMRIKDCCLLANVEWKPGHGMTASMKLDRKAIQKIHKSKIQEMYRRNGVEISAD